MENHVTIISASKSSSAPTFYKLIINENNSGTETVDDVEKVITFEEIDFDNTTQHSKGYSQLSSTPGSWNSEMAPSSDVRNANISSCYINLISTIIGAGILGIPYGVSTMGWVLGLILLTICGISSALALYYLTCCAALAKSPVTFHQIAEMTIPGYSWIIDAAIAIKCFGICISYMIIVGDLMPTVMHTFQTIPFFQQRSVWIIIAFLIATPFTYFKHLDSLKYTSLISLIFILILTIVVILYSIPSSGFDPCYHQHDKVCHGETYILSNSLIKAMKGLPVFIFSYTCQQNTFAMVNEMVAPTQTKFNTVILSCISTAWILYVIVAICGYITYGAANTTDLLQNYPETVLTTIARICVSSIVLSHYPLQAHPSRQSFLSLWQRISPLKKNATNTALLSQDETHESGISLSYIKNKDPPSSDDKTSEVEENVTKDIKIINKTIQEKLSSSSSSQLYHRRNPLHISTDSLLPNTATTTTTTTTASSNNVNDKNNIIISHMEKERKIHEHKNTIKDNNDDDDDIVVVHNVLHVQHNTDIRKEEGKSIQKGSLLIDNPTTTNTSNKSDTTMIIQNTENIDINDHLLTHTSSTTRYSSLSTSSSSSSSWISILISRLHMPPDLLRNRIVTTLFLLLTFIIAISIKDLGFMIALVGSTGAVIVSYILPGLCYYKLITNGPLFLRYIALLQFIIGMILLPFCTIVIFI